MNNTYQNNTITLDRSFHEPARYMWKECNVDVFGFLDIKGFSFIATKQSISELIDHHPDSSLNLFNGHVAGQITTSYQGQNDFNNLNLIISKADGSISSGFYENGYQLKIESVNMQSSTIPLWDCYPPFIRSAKSEVDKSNIYYQRENKNNWVATNDEDQIKAIKLTLGNYFRPVDMLVWMVNDKFIKNPKAIWTYARMKIKDKGWVPKNITFTEYKKIIKTIKI